MSHPTVVVRGQLVTAITLLWWLADGMRSGHARLRKHRLITGHAAGLLGAYHFHGCTMTPPVHAAEQRLLDLGLVLPPASGPAGNYAPAARSGNLLFLSGKAPVAEGAQKPKGQLGRDYTAEDGYRLARSACLDLLSALQAALGSLDKVSRIIELHGALNATEDFEDHALVLDGASDLLVEVFGPAGVHARSVIGVSSLRGGVPLTVRATVECTPD